MPKPIDDNKEVFELLGSYLKRVSFLNEEEFKLLIPFLKIRKFEKKQVITNIGEVEQYFNFIVKGLVRKYIINGKKEITLQLSHEKHFILSEVSYYFQQPSDAIIETIEPTVVLSMHHQFLDMIFNNYPHFEKAGRLIVTELYVRKERHYYAQLRYTTRERFLNFMETSPGMLQRVPQKYLASYLNIKPETFSRLKHLLLKKKPEL